MTYCDYHKAFNVLTNCIRRKSDLDEKSMSNVVWAKGVLQDLLHKSSDKLMESAVSYEAIGKNMKKEAGN